MSEKSLWTMSRSSTTASARRREAIVPSLAVVINFSATGRRRRALVSVVRIRSSRNRAAARPASISLSWAGPDPSRAPFGGLGTRSAPFPLLEAETQLGELLLDLLDGLLPEVADVEQVLLGSLDELADGGDALPLQAVVGANREVEVLDRGEQIGAPAAFSALGTQAQAGSLGEVGEELEELDERTAGCRQGLLGGEAPVGGDVDDEAGLVGPPPRARALRPEPLPPAPR